MTRTDGTDSLIDNPLNYPDPSEIETAEEPFARVSIITPPEYVGGIMDLCQERRGEYLDMTSFVSELLYSSNRDHL